MAHGTQEGHETQIARGCRNIRGAHKVQRGSGGFSAQRHGMQSARGMDKGAAALDTYLIQINVSLSIEMVKFGRKCTKEKRQNRSSAAVVPALRLLPFSVQPPTAPDHMPFHGLLSSGLVPCLYCDTTRKSITCRMDFRHSVRIS